MMRNVLVLPQFLCIAFVCLGVSPADMGEQKGSPRSRGATTVAGLSYGSSLPHSGMLGAQLYRRRDFPKTVSNRTSFAFQEFDAQGRYARLGRLGGGPLGEDVRTSIKSRIGDRADRPFTTVQAGTTSLTAKIYAESYVPVREAARSLPASSLCGSNQAPRHLRGMRLVHEVAH